MNTRGTRMRANSLGIIYPQVQKMSRKKKKENNKIILLNFSRAIRLIGIDVIATKVLK